MRFTGISFPLVLLPAVLAGPSDLSAQVLGGQVILEGESPLAGAQVVLLQPSGRLSNRTETDEAGRFRFPNLMPGKYFVNVDGPGCESWQAGPMVLEKGDSVLLSLDVAFNRVPDPPFRIVSSRRPWYEHLQPAGLWPFWERRDYYEVLGTGAFFTSADLAPWIGNPVTLTLSALSPFLQTEPTSTGFLLRGPRGCTPLLFIDGFRVRQGTEGISYREGLRRPIMGADTDHPRMTPESRSRFTPIDQFVSVSQLAGVEVYRGASDVPGEFRREEFGTRCGAVVIWSHRGPTG